MFVDHAVEPISPDMRAGLRLDELRGDAHAVARLAHAALQHIAHAEFAPDLLHVDGAALVGEAGIARDDEEPADARQRRGDLLDHAVGKIVLVGIAAQVGERQDGNRGTVGLPRCRRLREHAGVPPRAGRSVNL